MKSKKLKIVAGIMVLTMLTTCMMSGTLAKYTTGDSASDSARIAKWGVQVEANGYLFGNSYGSDNQVVAAQTFNTLAVSETARARDNWVAPGTKNDNGFSFSITGEPEVSGEIKSVIKTQNIFLREGHYGVLIPLEESEITSENYNEYLASGKLYVLRAGGYNLAINPFEEDVSYYFMQNELELSTDYYPVVYSLNGVTAANGIGSDSLQEIAESITNQIGNPEFTDAVNGVSTYEGTGSFSPSTISSANQGIILANQVITWKWSYENGDSEEEKIMYNTADTFLEMLNNSTTEIVVKYDNEYREYNTLEKYTDYNLETQFDINLTVTQTD